LRDYGIGAQILRDLGVRRVRLLTNNPQKIVGLETYGVDVVARAPLEVVPHSGNIDYLPTKQAKLGHLLSGLTRSACPLPAASPCPAPRRPPRVAADSAPGSA